MRNREYNLQPPNLSLRGAGAAIGAAVIVLALLIVGAASFVNIRPGYVGVLFDAQAHEVKTEFLRPGFGFKLPLVQIVQEYPIGTQVLTMVAKQQEGRI